MEVKDTKATAPRTRKVVDGYTGTSICCIKARFERESLVLKLFVAFSEPLVVALKEESVVAFVVAFIEAFVVAFVEAFIEAFEVDLEA